MKYRIKLFINSFLQLFAGLEFWLLGGGNFDRLARARIAARAGGAAGHGKGTKAHEAHIIALLQASCNRFQNGFNRFGRLLLGHIGFFGNQRYQILFVHGNIPFSLE